MGEGIPPQEGEGDVLQQHRHGVVRAKVLAFMADEPAPLRQCESLKSLRGHCDDGKEPASNTGGAVSVKNTDAVRLHINRQLVVFRGSRVSQTPGPALKADALNHQSQQQKRGNEPREAVQPLHGVVQIPCWCLRGESGQRHHFLWLHLHPPVVLEGLANRCEDRDMLLEWKKITNRDVEGAVEAHQHGQIRQDAAAQGITDDEAHQKPCRSADDEAVNDEIEQSDGLRAHDSPPFFARTSLRSSVSSSSVMSPLSTRQRTRARLLPPKKRCFSSASTLVRPRCSGTAGS